jgi:hypothetical protein
MPKKVECFGNNDSSLIFSSTNPLEVEDRLNLDLQVLDNWAKQWLVDFNPQKTECMVISFWQNIMFQARIFNCLIKLVVSFLKYNL